MKEVKSESSFSDKCAFLTFLVFACVQDKIATSVHCFTEGMKLEAIDPTAPFHICPATVTKVTSNLHLFPTLRSAD